MQRRGCELLSVIPVCWVGWGWGREEVGGRGRKAAEIFTSGFRRGIEIHKPLLLFQPLFCIRQFNKNELRSIKKAWRIQRCNRERVGTQDHSQILENTGSDNQKLDWSGFCWEDEAVT